MTLREEVERRARGRCEYCHSQARFSTQTFALEHVIPRSRGGHTVTDNLALACQGCNNHKYNRTQWADPATGRLVPLFHPRRDVRRDHFAWDESFELMVGLTPIGRATIEALQLNRQEVVNLRRGQKRGHH